MAGQAWSTLTHTVLGTLQGLVKQGAGRSDAIQPGPIPAAPAQPGAVPGAILGPIPTDAVPQISYYSVNVQERFPADLFTAVRTPPPLSQGADIRYEYNERKHLARKASRLQAGGLRTDLPKGWPKALEGPLVWTTSDYLDESLYAYSLSTSDKTEIVDALEHFKGRLNYEDAIMKLKLDRLGQERKGH